MKYSREIVLALVLMLSAAPLVAQDTEQKNTGFPGDVPKRFRLSIGSVFGNFNTNLAYSTEGGGLGALVNLEDLLGVEANSSSFRFLGVWRYGPRSSLIASYVGFNRSGDRAPARDFTFLGYTIQAGTAVQSDFNSKMMSLSYRYDVYENDEIRLYGSAGATYLKLSSNLMAGIGVIGPDGNPIIGRGIAEERSIKAPIPLLGVGVEWAATRRILVEFYLRGMYARVGDFDGGITEVGLSGTWFFVRNVGLGFGLERTDIRVNEYNGSDFTARGNYSQLGTVVWLTAAF